MTPIEPGQRFGRLTVISLTRVVRGRNCPQRLRAAVCLCDCGTEKTILVNSLTSTNRPTKSCGCWHRERGIALLVQQNLKHGLHQHPLYPTWNGMMARCYNERCSSYEGYGGRGITVCAEWHDVATFIGDMERLFGPRPEGMSIDRINNNRNYEPGNVRWADGRTQNRNKRNAKLSMADALEICRLRAGGWRQHALAAEFGVGQATISMILSGKRWREAQEAFAEALCGGVPL